MDSNRQMNINLITLMLIIENSQTQQKDTRPLTKADLKDKVRTGGAKGKQGSADFTKGKKQFARPCTVGWKSQNQPLKRGGGNRTPL
tara:strand:- start:1925 stop:2185 length:261 start_codon:yes stop_codon:yes gene_type:complete